MTIQQTPQCILENTFEMAENNQNHEPSMSDDMNKFIDAVKDLSKNEEFVKLWKSGEINVSDVFQEISNPQFQQQASIDAEIKKGDIAEDQSKKEQSSIPSDPTINRRAFLYKIGLGVAAVGGTAALMAPNKAQALGGADAAATINFWATVRMPFEEVTSKLSAEMISTTISDTIKDWGKQALDNATKRFRLDDENNTKQIAAIAAQTDTLTSDANDKYNKDVHTSMQIPPSACTSDHIGRIENELEPDTPTPLTAPTIEDIDNKAPLDKKVNLMKENQIILQQANQPEDTFNYFCAAPHLSLHSYTNDSAKQAKIFFQNIKGETTNYKKETHLESNSQIDYESRRLTLIARQSTAQHSFQHSQESRKGTREHYHDLLQTLEAAENADDQRMAAFAKAGVKSLKEIGAKTEEKLSKIDKEEFETNQRRSPEYNEYLRQLGNQPEPYLRELISIGAHTNKLLTDHSRRLERVELILSTILTELLDSPARKQQMAEYMSQKTI